MSKTTEFLKETKNELKKVTWPSRAQTISYTFVVVILSLILAYLLGFFDFLFGMGLEKLLNL